MAITVYCQKCGRETRVADELAGKKIRCPGCREPVTVTDTAAREQLMPRPARRKPHRPFADDPAAGTEEDDDPTTELANPSYSSLTLDSSTRASNPGRIRVNPIRFWICYPKWPTLWLVLTLIGVALMPLGKFALTVSITSGILFVLYWIRVREHFLHGCALPAIVLSPETGLVAVCTDLSTGEGEYLAVRILHQPLSRMTGAPAKKGQRLVAVALYEADPSQSDHWATFHPRIVNCVTGNTAAIEQSLRTISEDDWQELLQLLRQVESREPGLYRLWDYDRKAR